MRRVEPAENAVPVSVVSLPAQKLVPCFLDLSGVLRAGPSRRYRRDTSGNSQHLLVKQVGLWIFTEESAPSAAAQKREQIGPRSKLLVQLVVAQPRAGR